MDATNKLKLSHFVLYSKGWYKRTDDLFDDLMKILKLDDYSPFTKSDVFSILVSNFENHNSQHTKLSSVLFGISPNECWKHGYYVKGSFLSDETSGEYDYMTAVVRYFMSYCLGIDDSQWVVKAPKYKEYPKKPGIELKKVIEQFSKRITK